MTGEVAMDILLRMFANFPGLVDEHSGDVPGADLVEWMTAEVYALLPDAEILHRASHGSPDDGGYCVKCGGGSAEGEALTAAPSGEDAEGAS